jgi:hypothetical protein
MPSDNNDDRIILLKEKSWRALKARVKALETSQRLLLRHIASMYASLLYPNNLEARVAASREKYRELLKALGLSQREQE